MQKFSSESAFEGNIRPEIAFVRRESLRIEIVFSTETALKNAVRVNYDLVSIHIHCFHCYI